MDSEDLMFYINKHKKAYEERVKRELQNSHTIPHDEEHQENEDKPAVQTNNVDPKEEIQTNRKNTFVNSISEDQNEAKRRKQRDNEMKENKNGSSKEENKETQASKVLNQEEADYLYALKLSEQLNGIIVEDSSDGPAILKHDECSNRQNIQKENYEKKQFVEDEVRKPDEIYTECLLGYDPNIQYQQSFRKKPHMINSLNNPNEINNRFTKKDTFEKKHETNKYHNKKQVDLEQINKSKKENINDVKKNLPLEENSINIETGVSDLVEKKRRQKEVTPPSTISCTQHIDKDTFKGSVQKEKTKKENRNEMVDKYYKQAGNHKISVGKAYIDGTALNPIDLTRTPLKSKTHREEANTKDKAYNTFSINKNLAKPTYTTQKKMNQEPNVNTVNHSKREHKETHHRERDHGEGDGNKEISYKNENEYKYIHTNLRSNEKTNNKYNESKNLLHETANESSAYSKNPSAKWTGECTNTTCLDRKKKFDKNKTVKVEDKKNDEEALRMYSRYHISNELKGNSQEEGIFYINGTKYVPLQNKNYEKYMKTTNTENNNSHVTGNLFLNKYNMQPNNENSSNEINRNEIKRTYVKRSEEGNNTYTMQNVLYPNEMEQMNSRSGRTIVFTRNVSVQKQPKGDKDQIISNEKLVRKR